MKLVLRVVAVILVLLVAAGLVFYFNPLWVADQNLRLRLLREGVRSEYVDAGGYRLHYLEALPAAGTKGIPLVLVHGLGARAEDWSAMMPALAASGFHVYAPDLLGYGRSPRPDVSYSIPMEVGAVEEFMHAVHLTHADVGGWSMGGWVAMKLALDHPELVDRLVVYDSAGVYFPATFGANLFVPPDTAGVQKLVTMLAPKSEKTSVMPGFIARAALRKLQRNGWVVSRSMAAMTDGRDLLDFRLHSIHQPTLVVWGSEDQLIPLSVGETIHERIPHSVLNIMDGCGHLAPAECATPVLKSTIDFLQAEPPMQGGEKTFPAER